MQRFSRLFPLLLLMLTLPGCFRPAGEAIEPTANPDAGETIESPIENPTVAVDPVTPAAQRTADVIIDVTEEAGGDASATPTFPPITILPAVRETEELGVNTVETQESAAETTLEVGSTAVATITRTFITPGVSSIPITPETPTPTRPSPTPGRGMDATPTAVSPNVSTDECIYIVQAGDSLYTISIDNNIDLEELRAANPQLDGNTIFPDDELNLPNCGENRVEPTVTGTPAPTREVGEGEIYIIQSGDTLFRIAQRYGITVDEILAVNDLVDPDRLAIGQEIIIPAGAQAEDEE